MTLLLTMLSVHFRVRHQMQGSPCPEVRTLTNENWRYTMKLNDYNITKDTDDDRNCCSNLPHVFISLHNLLDPRLQYNNPDILCQYDV